MKLYELSSDFDKLYSMFDEEGMDVDAWYDTLDGIEQEAMDKLESIAVLIKEFSADIKMLEDEEMRIHARRKSAETKVGWLKNYSMRCMAMINLNKVKGIRATITRCEGRTSVSIPDEESFIRECLETNNNSVVKAEVKYKIDKDRVKTMLENGIEFRSAQLVKKPYLLIK